MKKEGNKRIKNEKKEERQSKHEEQTKQTAHGRYKSRKNVIKNKRKT